MNVYAVLAGIVSAILVVLVFRAWRLEDARWAYPLLLAEFPLNYWVFAVFASDSAALLKECLVGVGFFAVAYIAYQFKSMVTLRLLAAGYVVHAVYDVFHNLLFVNAGTPTWWPEYCATVDVLLGAYIAYRAVGASRQSPVA